MSIKAGDIVKIDYNGRVMKLRLQEESGKNCAMVDSPVGQALIGKSIGDGFTVKLPWVIKKIKVLGINAGDALP